MKPMDLSYADQAYFIWLSRHAHFSDKMYEEILAHNEGNSDLTIDPKLLRKEWRRMKPWQRELRYGEENAYREKLPASLASKLEHDLEEAIRDEATLNQMGEDELRELYKTALAEHRQLEKENLKTTDQDRFFHDPLVSADFEFWNQASALKPKEAVALSLGKDPRLLKLKQLKRIRKEGSAFADDYFDRFELLKRAVAVGELSKPIGKADFLRWASKKAWSVPAQMGVVAGDDAEPPEPLSKAEPAAASNLDPAVPSQKKLINELRAERTANQIKHRSLIKLVGTLAYAYHGYDPESGRNNTVNTIFQDAENYGLDIGKDAIRGYLREAAELMPPDKKGELND